MTVSPSPEQLSELCKRLRSKDQPFGWAGDGKWCEYSNPDGPEAAAALESTQAEIARLTTALRSAKMLCDNINEFGSVTDHEIFDGADEAISAVLKGNGTTPRSVKTIAVASYND